MPKQSRRRSIHSYERSPSRALHGSRPLDDRPRRRAAPSHPAQPRHHRGRHPCRGLDHRHQHAREADRAGRGRADGLHGRDLRHPAHDGRPRALHRHPGTRERQARRARAPLRDVHRRAVQGALARGDARPLLQHAVRALAAGRGRAPRGQEPPLVPRALVHAARHLRALGRALRRRHRGLLPGAAHRRHRQPRARSAARTASIPRRCARSPSAARRSSTGRARRCR